MSGKSPFDADWRESLRAHMMYVFRINDKVTERTLRGVLKQAGFTDEDLQEMYIRATAHVDDVGGDFVPDPEMLSVSEAHTHEHDHEHEHAHDHTHDHEAEAKIFPAAVAPDVQEESAESVTELESVGEVMTAEIAIDSTEEMPLPDEVVEAELAEAVVEAEAETESVGAGEEGEEEPPHVAESKPSQVSMF